MKDLKLNKLVKREVHKTIPVTVQSSITSYGKTTRDLIEVLVDWGKNHRYEMISSE